MISPLQILRWSGLRRAAARGLAAQRRCCVTAREAKAEPQAKEVQSADAAATAGDGSDARRASDAAFEGLTAAVTAASSADASARDLEAIAAHVEACRRALERERRQFTAPPTRPQNAAAALEPAAAAAAASAEPAGAAELLQQLLPRVSDLEARAGTVPLALFCMSEEVPEAAGRWELLSAGGKSGGPVWAKGPHRMFTDPDGRWMCSPDDRAMRVGSGWIHSKWPHGGVLPHGNTEWEYWSGTGWVVADSIQFTVASDRAAAVATVEDRVTALERSVTGLLRAVDVLNAGQYRRTHNSPPPLSMPPLPPPPQPPQ